MPSLAELIDDRLILNLHPGQRQAWDSTARFVAVIAGTQGGKTSFAPHWLYREIVRRGPGDYLFVTPTYPLLELKALPEMLRVFGQWLELGDYTASPRRVFTFSEEGCERTFGENWDPDESPETRILFGYATDPESLESATARAAVCDEAGQKKFKLGAWEAILRRLSLAQGRVLITTSVYSLGWLRDKYERWRAGDKDWEFIRFDSTLNPAFPQEEFERAGRDLPRWKFDMLYRGLWSRPAGLIYDNYDPTAHRCPRFALPRHWRRLVGIDFGAVNTAAVFLAEEPPGDKPGQKPGFSEAFSPARYYLYRTYHAGGRSASGHVREILRGEPPLAHVCGGAASEEAWRNEFRAAGLPVRQPRVAEVEVGIDRIYSLLGRGALIVFDDLVEFNDEITTYSRALDDEGNPTTEIDAKSTYHLLDALRYIAGDIAGPAKTAVAQRPIEFY